MRDLALMIHVLVNINFCFYLGGKGLRVNSVFISGFYELIAFQIHLHPLLIKNPQCLPFLLSFLIWLSSPFMT